MARIGYIRISTAEQHTARQESALEGCSPIFRDICSGKNAQRPELEKMLTYVRKGDTLVIESFSRLARSTKDLLKIVDFLQQKGVEIVSLKENLDTATPAGRLMMTMFAALAEFEREQMLERQSEGIRAAKAADAALRAAGKPAKHYTGRTPVAVDPAAFQREYKAWKAGKQTAVETMKKLHLRRGTFYNRVNDYEIEKGIKKP